jgi:cytochrome c oxidase assembly factor CtaG
MENTESFLTELLVASISSNLLMLIVGFLVMWGVLRLLDKSLGLDFAKRIGGMNDVALAIYLGARIVAFAIFVGMGIS